jgi:hypothetical protein
MYSLDGRAGASDSTTCPATFLLDAIPMPLHCQQMLRPGHATGIETAGFHMGKCSLFASKRVFAGARRPANRGTCSLPIPSRCSPANPLLPPHVPVPGLLAFSSPLLLLSFRQTPPTRPTHRELPPSKVKHLCQVAQANLKQAKRKRKILTRFARSLTIFFSQYMTKQGVIFTKRKRSGKIFSLESGGKTPRTHRGCFVNYFAKRCANYFANSHTIPPFRAHFASSLLSFCAHPGPLPLFFVLLPPFHHDPIPPNEPSPRRSLCSPRQWAGQGTALPGCTVGNRISPARLPVPKFLPFRAHFPEVYPSFCAPLALLPSFLHHWQMVHIAPFLSLLPAAPRSPRLSPRSHPDRVGSPGNCRLLPPLTRRVLPALFSLRPSTQRKRTPLPLDGPIAFITFPILAGHRPLTQHAPTSCTSTACRGMFAHVEACASKCRQARVWG